MNVFYVAFLVLVPRGADTLYFKGVFEYNQNIVISTFIAICTKQPILWVWLAYKCRQRQACAHSRLAARTRGTAA